jgi:uncharacterized protein
MNLATHTFQDVFSDPVWRKAFDASLNLHANCNSCVYRNACGGGHLAHRWSRADGFDNPSVYCEDLKGIFQHVWQSITRDMVLKTDGGDIPLNQAISNAKLGEAIRK